MATTYGDSDVVRWGINRIREYQYRKLFHLSKKQMMEEPLEDFNINITIEDLINEYSERKSREVVKKPHKA